MNIPAGRSMVMYDFDIESSTVGCLDMRGERFSEPFMIDTIERRLRERPRPFAAAGDYRDLCSILQGQRTVPVEGLIYHTGRCGSTLVANALSSMTDTMVLKEAPFFSAQAAEFLMSHPDASSFAARVRELQQSCLPPTADEQVRQIWKFASWNVLADSVWAQAFPEAGAVFLWRPCLEVMASEISSPPLWANGKGRVASDMFDAGKHIVRKTGLDSLPLPQRISLAAWISVALKGIEIGRAGTLVLEYSSIQKDLAGSLIMMCSRMGIPLTRGQAEVAAEVRRFYSKDPSGRREFRESDSTPPISGDDASRIQGVVREFEQELRAMSQSPS